MTLALTCALCLTQTALPASGAFDTVRPALIAERLTLHEFDAAPPVPSELDLALARSPDQGSGGDDGHSDHMGTMWIVMGAMMAVMMVGVGVYAMRHNSTFMERSSAGQPSPAQLAIPVTASPRGG
jgi:hypothetical protein